MTSTLNETRTDTATDQQAETALPRFWNVVLFDSDDHSYEYVVRMLTTLFRLPVERAFVIAQTVDLAGRCVCLTTHKEHAELKQVQIHSFGPDVLVAGCNIPMRSIIEPAAGDDEDADHPDQ